MPSKEQILGFVRRKGAVLPNDIRKELGGDTFLIGALLSEMKKDGLIKISHTKIGSSPTYYAVGNEARLLDLMKYLKEKDRETVHLLREKKVLRDREQELLIRVSLRNIKDFAKPIDVKVKNDKEVFWKWFLTPMNEAEGLIRKHFSTSRTERKIESLVKEEKQEVHKSERQEHKKEERQEVFKEDEPVKKRIDDDFSLQLKDYFDGKNIVVLEEDIIRKNSDIELKLKVPSAVGNVEYFCKAKNKKKCNDGDLSSAYLKGQVMKTPVLFITTGEVTKKAKSMLETEFKGMVVKQL